MNFRFLQDWQQAGLGLFNVKAQWNRAGNLLGSRQSDVFGAAALIMVSYGLSAVLGLLRQRLLGATFYDCCAGDLDVYKAAFRWPDMLVQLVASGVLSAAFIPTFSRLLDDSDDSASKMASSLLHLLLLVMGIGSVIIFIFAEPLSRLITGDFSPDQIETMVTMTRWLLLGQVFILISQWTSGILQSYHRFLAPALTPLFYNVGIIGGIMLFSGQLGIYSAVLGAVVGAIFHFMIQIPALWKTDFRYDWKFPRIDTQIKQIFTLSIPRTLTLSLAQVELHAAVKFATSLSSGSLFLYDLAMILRQVPVQLIGVAIGQAAFPSLSRHAGSSESQFKKVLSSTSLQIAYLVLPLTMLLLVLRIPVVRLLFGAETFPWRATVETGATVAMFSLAIPAYAIGQLLTRAFYALKDTMTPLLINGIGTLLFGLLGWWIIQHEGESFLWFNFLAWEMREFEYGSLQGLALVSSITGVLQMVLLLYYLQKRLPFMTAEWITGMKKVLLATGVLFLSMRGLFRYLDRFIFDTTRVIPLVMFTMMVSCIGLMVYLIASHVLKVKEQYLIWRFIIKFPGLRGMVRKLQSIGEPLTLSGSDTEKL